MNWPFVVALISMCVSIMACSFAVRNYRKSMRLLRHQGRIENQVARRDFLIKELRAMWAEIEEDEGLLKKAIECPRCGEIALVKGEIVNGLQEFKCLECGHFEY